MLREYVQKQRFHVVYEKVIALKHLQVKGLTGLIAPIS